MGAFLKFKHHLFHSYQLTGAKRRDFFGNDLLANYQSSSQQPPATIHSLRLAPVSHGSRKPPWDGKIPTTQRWSNWGRRQAHPLTGQDTLESAGLASGAVAMANVVFTVWIAHLGSV